MLPYLKGPDRPCSIGTEEKAMGLAGNHQPPSSADDKTELSCTSKSLICLQTLTSSFTFYTRISNDSSQDKHKRDVE
jgi:hypothetical protein